MNLKEYAGVNSIYEKPNGEKLTHEEVYTKIVNAIGLNTCAGYMPISIEKLKTALEKDEHLNTIQLKKWDDMQPIFRYELGRIGINTHSLSDTVCTLKQAARMLVAREYPETK